MRHNVTKSALLVAVLAFIVAGILLLVKSIPAAIGIATLTGWLVFILLAAVNSNELKKTGQQKSS
jgi:hypothetical protein